MGRGAKLAKVESRGFSHSHRLMTYLSLLLCLSLISAAVAASKPHYPAAQSNTIISTTNAPPGPYGAQQAILDERGSLTTSVQYGILPTTNKLISTSVKEQMTQAMTNMAAVFTAAGLNFRTDATSCWLYGAAEINAKDFGVISTVYNTFFPNQQHHPARNPTSAHLLCTTEKTSYGKKCNGNPLIGVMCHGFPNGGVRVVPPSPFFDTDFNAQGLLVDQGSRLYTSAQVGIDPTAGANGLQAPPLVNGGAVNETRQAMSNIAKVFATAFPKEGKQALVKHASECQLIVVNTTGKIKDELWQQVKNEYESFFSGRPQGDLPPVAISSFPVGTLPIPANVAVSCNGMDKSIKKNSSTLPWYTTVGQTTYLQTAGHVGSNVQTIYNLVASDFATTFPKNQWNTSGWRWPSVPAKQQTSSHPIHGTVTECQLWIANIAAPREIYIENVLDTLSDLFHGQLPPLTVTKDGTLRDCTMDPVHGLAHGDCYTLQCLGSITAPPKPVCIPPNGKCNYVDPEQGLPCCFGGRGGCTNVHAPNPGICDWV